jgi:Na+-driven multidrug efflux pump
VLVFGVGPLPALGAVGAAWATLMAQSIKAGVLLRQLFGRRSPISWPPTPTPREWRRLGQSLLRLSLPLSVKELFWSSGVFLYTVLFARAGTSALAASQIAAALEAVFVVASIGLMTAATILIGQAVGAGDLELARTRERALLRAGTVTGLAFAAAYMSTIGLLPILYPHVGTDVLRIATWGIVINGVTHVVKVRNMIVVGMLPSGGDTRGVVIGDIAGAFTIGLPVGYLLTFQLGLGVWGIFAGRAIEELIKLAFFGWRAARLPWGRHAARTRAATVGVPVQRDRS